MRLAASGQYRYCNVSYQSQKSALIFKSICQNFGTFIVLSYMTTYSHVVLHINLHNRHYICKICLPRFLVHVLLQLLCFDWMYATLKISRNITSAALVGSLTLSVCGLQFSLLLSLLLTVAPHSLCTGISTGLQEASGEGEAWGNLEQYIVGK